MWTATAKRKRAYEELLSDRNETRSISPKRIIYEDTCSFGPRRWWCALLSVCAHYCFVFYDGSGRPRPVEKCGTDKAGALIKLT
eukprot:2989291-Pyramimonas_sp.AAC.1